MLESLDGRDPLGLVETEELLEEVHSLAGHYAGRGGVSRESSSSKTLTDLRQVGADTDLTERDFSLVPDTSLLSASQPTQSYLLAAA